MSSPNRSQRRLPPAESYAVRLRKLVRAIRLMDDEVPEDAGSCDLYFDFLKLADPPDWTNQIDIFEDVCRYAETILQTDHLDVTVGHDVDRDVSYVRIKEKATTSTDATA